MPLAALPEGDLYLHLDVDVVDPQDVPDLRYPALGRPSAGHGAGRGRAVLATGPVVAVGVAATWRQDVPRGRSTFS